MYLKIDLWLRRWITDTLKTIVCLEVEEEVFNHHNFCRENLTRALYRFSDTIIISIFYIDFPSRG